MHIQIHWDTNRIVVYTVYTHDAKKKGQLILVHKKTRVLRRVVEGLFLSDAGPTSGCLSYLIAIMRKETSDVWQIALISVRYDKHPLFGPASDQNKHSITRRKPWFFLDLFYLFCQLTFFFSITFKTIFQQIIITRRILGLNKFGIMLFE